MKIPQIRINFQKVDHGGFRSTEAIFKSLDLPDTASPPVVGDYVIRDGQMLKVVGRRWSFIGEENEPDAIGLSLMLDDNDKKFDWRG